MATSGGTYEVSGSESAGALALTGQATAAGQTSTLQQTEFRIVGTELVGTYTISGYRLPSFEPPILVISLERVFKQGTPEGVQPLPIGSRYALVGEEGTATRFRPGVSPGVTTYMLCARFSNAARMAGQVTTTLPTPVGPDGRDYILGYDAHSAPFDERAGTFSACALGLRDLDYQRPIGTTYRLQVQIQYSDGAQATEVVTGKIRVTQDNFNGS